MRSAQQRSTDQSIGHEIAEAATVSILDILDTVFQRRTVTAATDGSRHREGLNMGISTKRKENKKDNTNLTPLPVDTRELCCTPVVCACVSCKIRNQRTQENYRGMHLVYDIIFNILYIIYYVLYMIYDLLSIIYYLLFMIHYLLSIIYDLLYMIYYIHYLFYIVYELIYIIYCILYMIYQ